MKYTLQHFVEWNYNKQQYKHELLMESRRGEIAKGIAFVNCLKTKLCEKFHFNERTLESEPNWKKTLITIIAITTNLDNQSEKQADEDRGWREREKERSGVRTHTPMFKWIW